LEAKKMNKKTDTKSLVEIKENGVWGKIKNFFKKVFYKKNESVEFKTINESVEEKTNINPIVDSTINNGFIQDNNKELYELQSKYRKGEIKESDLTKEQIKQLSDLYDKQIKELRASNEVRKQRLLKYREKMATTNA
jgi:hypothetical protein